MIVSCLFLLKIVCVNWAEVFFDEGGGGGGGFQRHPHEFGIHVWTILNSLSSHILI